MDLSSPLLLLCSATSVNLNTFTSPVILDLKHQFNVLNYLASVKYCILSKLWETESTVCCCFTWEGSLLTIDREDKKEQCWRHESNRYSHVSCMQLITTWPVLSSQFINTHFRLNQHGDNVQEMCHYIMLCSGNKTWHCFYYVLIVDWVQWLCVESTKCSLYTLLTTAHSLTALLLQQWLIIMRLGSLSLWSLRENINNQQVSLVCLCWVQQIHFSFLRTLSLTMMNFVTSRFLINDCWHGWVRGEFY